MSDTIVPESRIFRIGRECYIVYLGKERDDIRPFLRIGNTRNIPDEIHSAISTTVVTDDHVGNPLLEILNAPKFPGRYLGDTAVVAEIRKFFKSFDLPTDDVTDYRKVKDGERRHMVWFYSSGNIHLRFDEKVIFDLHKREKDDRHFIRLFEEAKAEFLRNPLRYIRQDFDGPGVVLSEGNAFWFEGGEMLSLMAHPGFVARLMYDGVDPDFISASVYDLLPEDMDSRDAAVYIGFVKRMRQRRKQLRVLTSRPELQRKLRLLFPARGDVPATLEVTDVSGKKKATFRDSIISRKDDLWRIHRAGLPEISIGGELPNGISIDVKEGRLIVGSNGNRTVYRTPQGFPIDFQRGSVPGNQMMDRYIGMVFSHIKNHLSEDERPAIGVLEKYLWMLRDDILAGKVAASPLLKQTASAARDGLKRLQVAEGGPSWFFYSNALSVAGVLAREAGTDHPLAKSADSVSAALGTLLSRIPAPDPILPFWADLYLEGESVLLWRATKRSFVPADIATARSVNGRIAEITSLDESPWQDDMDRLLKLIRSLGQGGQGPLTEEEMALLKAPEDEPVRKEPEKRPETGTSAAAPPLTEKTGPAARGTGAETPKSPVKANRSSRGRAWIWILLILLLLIGGAVAWDLTGRAPWGRLLTIGNDTDGADAERDASSPIDAGDESGDTGTTGGTGSEAVGSTTETGGDAASETDEPGGTSSTDGGQTAMGEDSTDTLEVVDADVAPRTMAEVEAYLDVDGRVAITEADIHLAANEIAVLNGYKDLDYRVYTGEDPDWIYPDNILKLPGSEDYTVRRGDTIWFLAAREVRVDVESQLVDFDRAVATLDAGDSSETERRESMNILSEIAGSSRAEAMRNMAAQELSSRS